MTTVIHIRNAPPGWRNNVKYVYIGRPSKWGNPYSEQKYGRERCIAMFATYLESNAALLRDIAAGELKDKILVCYCKPLACHGDILAAKANSL